MTNDTLVEPQQLADLAQRIARIAGARIHELRSAGVTVAATKSSAVDMVTEADRECERLIVAALREARPDDGILGEEGTGIEGTSGITWVLDPIDGTTNYLYNLPAYAVSIAATVVDPDAFADGRRGVAAAVYSPRSDEMFDAWLGGGARLNGETISISGNVDLGTSLIGTGFGYTVERKLEQLELLQRVLPRVRDIRRIGSAAYDLCMTAAGRLDAFYEKGLQPWDYAGAALIATEAGAEIIGRDDSTPPGEPLIFVGDPGFVRELRAIALGHSTT